MVERSDGELELVRETDEAGEIDGFVYVDVDLRVEVDVSIWLKEM